MVSLVRPPPRVLVVEDQMLLALALTSLLEDIGCEAVGPVAQVVTALPIVMKEPLDAALLDIRLADESVEPIAAILIRRGIPFAFVTGHARDQIPIALRDRPYVGKPFTDSEIKTVVRDLLKDRTP
jgi:two-component SAPR family response regulator